jgi:hypothetical protein
MRPTFQLNGVVQIPLDWTPEQARAVIEILGSIEEEIWSLYGDDIMKIIKSQRTSVPRNSDPQNAHLDSSDDFPF